MRPVNVNELKENQIIAEHVLTDDFQVLLSKGTVLKKEYIDKLKEMDIFEVYIEDDIGELEEFYNEEIRNEIKKRTIEVKESCSNQVKKILQEHTLIKNKELSDIKIQVDEILNNILENENMVDKVFEIRKRSADLFEHSIEVGCVSMILALRLKLSKEETREIGIAGILHDLGLRYTTMIYQNVDIEDFTDYEKEEYKKHTVYGYTAIQNEEWISENVKEMMLSHHENKLGTGYPLHKTDLSLETQILAVCEIMDEMICGIGYVSKKTWEVLPLIDKMRGELYDEPVVDALLHFMAAYPIGTKIVLNDGSLGIVVKQNEKISNRPVVQIIKRGKILEKWSESPVTLVNLAEENDFMIVGAT